MTKYFIDLDNTLCKTQNGDYENSVPISERIEEVKRLYDAGHYVVIWTARGSKSGVDWRELTLKQLDQWSVPYHELLMGKPDYDIYVDDKSFNVNHVWPLAETNNKKSLKTNNVDIVKKGWGKEIIIANNDDYCGKILCFQKDKRLSMHYHMKKRETWYIAKGSFVFLWIDIENGKEVKESLQVGDVITLERGQPHQLIALEDDSQVFEVSTRHYNEDSCRIRKGD
jgi:mannose-6-phosphate isomerase-like protein (cupin superfamily)